MKISELADLAQLTPKELTGEIEALRPDLESQGHKLAKRLTAASAITEATASVVLAALDERRKESRREAEAEAAATRKREAEEAARKKAEEATAKAAQVAQDAKRRSDEELERRRRLIAGAGAGVAPPVPPVPHVPPVPPVAPAHPAAGAPAPPPAAAVPPPPPPHVSAPVAPPPPPMVITGRGGVDTQSPPPAPQAAAPAQAPTRPAQPSAPRRPGDDSRRPPANRDQPGGPRRTGDRDRQPREGQARPGGAPGKASDVNLKAFQDAVTGGDALGGVTAERPRRGRGKDDPARKKTPEGGVVDDGAPRRKAGKPTRAPAGPKDRHYRPTRVMDTELARRPGGRPERGRQKGRNGGSSDRHQVPETPKVVRLTGDFTVGQFAEKINLPVAEIMKKLFLMGEMLTINQVLNPDMAELLAADLGVEVTIEREGDEFDVESFLDKPDAPESLRPRAPIVTIMGHVDHGKTTLLDTIRRTHVADKEAGGITQHIGAYHVTTDKGDITFLDTPGHAAFTAMRARGANVTDLVVLVVAANDGVKPQTEEAISHAKAARVPIIVAINKIDVPGANIDRVKNELMRFELIAEDLGGDTTMVPISAKAGTNVQDLLEIIALQAEILELKANPDRDAVGAIVESHVDSMRGAVATVLVQRGTLRVGDIFVCGSEYGRVRMMRDDKGNTIESAGPAHPVEILGITGSPAAGDSFVVVPEESMARDIAERRGIRRKVRSARSTPHITLDSLQDHLREGEVKGLNLIVKGDVQGSVEAICASLLKIKSDKVQLRILHSGVGAVSEGDVQLADASDAIIISFNVRPDAAARDLALRTGVQIRAYSIIYELLEEIEAAMLGMLEPTYEEVPQGRAVVRQPFRISKVGTIAGSFIEDGVVAKNHKARLVRGGNVIWQGDIASLRRHKDDAKEVMSGLECGIGLANYNDIKEGDVIETYTLKEIAASLVTATPAGSSPKD